MDIDFDCQPHTTSKAISSVYSELLENDENLNRQPSYQRNPVWDVEQKGNLVDSIMKRCPMPVFLLYAYPQDVSECIDGQNRLTTIKEYIEQSVPDTPVPWPWVLSYDDRVEYVFFMNPVTQKAMSEYCVSKSKPAKGSKLAKVYRLMTPIEVKKFNSYQCTISEIQTKLTFDQRTDIFLRWQSGTKISQCDRFKNDDTPFCKFVVEQGLERSLSDRISNVLKTGRKNWLFDLYRLIHVFYDGNTKLDDVLISTIKSRTRIKTQTEEDFSLEETKNAIKRCEKFLGRFYFLEKVKQMYISFLLQLAHFWHTSLPHIRETLEKEEFLLKFAEENLNDEKMEHNTLNNGPNEKSVVANYPLFKQAILVAYDQQKPQEAEPSKKKKDTIPTSRKTETWNAYIGEEIGKAKCLCCGIREITSRDFSAGHVLSESDGGTIDVENLRPICSQCNLGMGSNYMIAWMKKMYPGRVLAGVKN